MRMYLLLDLGEGSTSGKEEERQGRYHCRTGASGKERTPLVAKAPDRLTVLTAVKKARESPTCSRCNQLGHSKSNKNCPRAGPAAVGAVKVGS